MLTVTFLNETVDYRDTTNLTYKGNWNLRGSYNASNVGETGTLASTEEMGATVTFTFPIPAIAFYYYGLPRCCGGLSEICIDCDPDDGGFIPIDDVNRTGDGKNLPIVLYSMRFSTPGIHDIIIMNTSNASELTIDRIDLEVITSSSDSDSTLVASAHSPSISAIVCGALGGAFVLFALVLWLFWFPLKQRRKESTGNRDPSPYVAPQTSSLPPLPSIPTASSPPIKKSSRSATICSGAARRYPSRYGYAPRPGKSEQPSFPAASPPVVSSESASQPGSSTASPPVVSSESTSQPGLSQLRREQDAGPVPAETEGSTLPPEYNEVFANAIRSSDIPPR
ncbi:hypothetical protein M413DRAFT_31077 [Hebeloma cylindrosporum]|uniref:Uncharacterized protein n=1 Tax=Hebeloma cylindrosporum TaxID=76867 RepID=A0A0C3BYN4_HEBCY|nr:hypothetical protein M413DRAFT_31077 [Hebeloma cylindrosporum h7]